MSKTALKKLYPLTQSSHRSKLMLWGAWAIMLLVGVSFIGYQATVRHKVVKAAQVPEKEAPVYQPTTGQALPSSGQLLSYLHALQVLAPVGSTVQIILPQSIPTSPSISNPSASAVTTTVQPLTDGLWQRGQKQFLMVQGSSSAGVDFSLLRASDLDLQHMILRLPPAQIFSTQVDNIVAYDVATGQKSTLQFGLLRPDSQIYEAKQRLALQACNTGLLQAATDSAAKQVITLLRLMSLNVTVQGMPPTPCEQPAPALSNAPPVEVVAPSDSAPVSTSGTDIQNGVVATS
jgi:hypothetical protein